MTKEDEDIYDDSLEGYDDLAEEPEEEDDVDFEEDDYIYDEVTGKRKPKISILNKKDLKEEDYDEVFDIEE